MLAKPFGAHNSLVLKDKQPAPHQSQSAAPDRELTKNKIACNTIQHNTFGTLE
jgi:hypothetical protein